MHGKQSEIYHDGTGIFTGLDSPVKVARYHSLAIIEKTLPDCLEIIAKTQDGEIMAVNIRIIRWSDCSSIRSQYIQSMARE